MARLSSVENKGQEVREENFSEKETQGQLLTVENDFISGMLAAAAYKNDELRQINITRDGKLYFSFKVHALGEEEANKCLSCLHKQRGRSTNVSVLHGTRIRLYGIAG